VLIRLDCHSSAV